ncbi:carboxypeptidase-like regulatory domain-containing protein [Chitinophaga sedimenti]|uniref:carboxypeptidase-like regulatory domain-containing protein n=1 Tax=Chitinophaga sedimenti TaxID=2033606 RepID=UPI0020059131|nr:carboxypeptidase-like regulatory domain-containing protein [Chitinophaga sedimenti]MCK7557414.1 carboxypeptidase-like regulatory domain-containing protein [Chitinophaga sedimenti]
MVEKPIATVLDKALANTALTYKISGNQVSIVTDPDKSTGPLREENDTLMTIKGRIFDSHEPPTGLPGVTIQVKNSRNGVLGDPDGYFSIKAKKNDVLLFTLMGYKSEEYLVTKSNSNLIIALKDNVAKLDEVVVTGLSEQQKKHIASSLSTLDIGSQIAGKPVTKLSQALQGGITGINVSQGSGLPGGDAAMVKIRGLSTITTNSDPLVLVDGVPMDMNNIDPVTVESVTVLKTPPLPPAMDPGAPMG